MLSHCQYAQRVVYGEEGLEFGDHAGIHERKWDHYVFHLGISAPYVRLRSNSTRTRYSVGGFEWPGATGL